MKKTFFKKLTLSKETIADLSKDQLSIVKGGQVTKYCTTGVYCTYGCTGPAGTEGTTCC